MGEFSRELCGGTHLENTGEVGAFEILGEEGVSAGTRRITALTGARAEEHIAQTRAALNEAAQKLGVAALDAPEAVKALSQQVRDLKKQLAGGGKSKSEAAPPASSSAPGEPDYDEVKHALREAARTLNVSPFEVPERIAAMQAEVTDLEKQLVERAASGTLTPESLLEKAEEIGGVRVVIAETPGSNANLMRQLIDQLRQTASPVAVLLAARQGDDKVTLVAGLSRDVVGRAKAGDWVRPVAAAVGGSGGGRPDMAQAGGKEPEKLPEALEVARRTITEMLGN
jgi:alanyl-tRNA synthetase